MTIQAKEWNLGSAKEASTVQVLKWAASHWAWITFLVAVVGYGYHFQMQWNEHVAPDCKSQPEASVCRIAKMDKKIDRMQETLDSILLQMNSRRK
jgi:hypothetical protein